MPDGVFRFMNSRNALQVVHIFPIFGIKKIFPHQHWTVIITIIFELKISFFLLRDKVCHNPVATGTELRRLDCFW